MALNLGTETGSLINHIYAYRDAVCPEVGMGCTILCWSDRKAGTIIRTFWIGNAPAIQVQRDNAKRTDDNGMSEMQEYEYSPNPDAYVETYKRYPDGWRQVVMSEAGRWKKSGGGILIGKREQYYDFSF